MIVCESTTHAYYPVRSRMQSVIRGTGRIRYVRGFLVVKPRRFAEPDYTLRDTARGER
jgi:hypothetical protein